MDLMTRNLMKDKVFVVRKKVQTEVERVTEGAMEQVLEYLQLSIKTVMKEKKKEMKRLTKSAMREMEQEMELLAIEPVIEQVKKQEIEPAMEPPMETVKKRAKKKRDLESTFSTQDAPAERNVNQRTSLDHQIKQSAQGELQLLFINKLPDKIYTNDKIKDVSDEFFVKLINTIDGKTINEGPLSSMEIKIHVLDGDFGSDSHENWTEEEFKDKIVRERKDKGPLLKGKQNITLKDGVGTIDLCFSDNSSWIKCKKFRLGARVLQSTSYMGQVRIKEAITEAFAVRDYRSKRAKKHDLPSLKDEVWHLKNVKKGGKFHTRLIDNDIQTVKHFNDMYTRDAKKLREILKDCTDEDWKEIVKDASRVVDDESPVLHQGSTGMQNYRNRASSSHGHKGGSSTAEEIVPNLAAQPLATSTDYPVNAQGVKSISDFHPPTNGVSGQNSSDQSNERGFHCSPNYIPLMTGSSQFNHGPHPHFPAAQRAFNAFEDAYSNPSLSQWGATVPLHHEYTVPNQGLAEMQNDCNPVSTFQYMSVLLQENVPNLTTQPPAMSIPYLNFPASPCSNFMAEYSQNNNGLHTQDTVDSWPHFWDDDIPPQKS
ncbi:hypothetical protein Ddye_026131 [Dipteronia dyeriana]|uniref:Calmodulin-binding protein n=1 Tax=Dipteronia dyeriana TaxID=168575 RepID=A0AAD9TLP9_9ROSI|nr:hypothetical protein Ddye_026131 [Dipteronia dyeriana]